MRIARGLVAGSAATALLGAAALGCTSRSPMPPPSVTAKAATPSTSASTSPSLSPSAAPSASPTVSATTSAEPPKSPSADMTPPSRSSAPAPPTRTTIPAKPTHLSMSVTTPGGRLDLVRGGAAQEFTVTVRNGNTRAYTHLRLVFQMEMLVDDTPAAERPPQDGFALQRWDAAAGTWRDEDLRIANDYTPPHLYTGGLPLPRDAVRTDRYRLRALAQGPTGSTPLLIHLIDTAADTRPAYSSLPHTTRRG